MGDPHFLGEAGVTLAWHPHALFIVIFLFFGLVTVLVNYFTVRRFDQYPPARKFPRVSVLVPARNEARNIAACVTSLLAQDYPDFEVIVLDDHSTDDTSRILAQLARTGSRLRVLKGASLPEDWLGKHWACQQLAQAATGKLILFTDADTRHAPDMLRASVSALLAEGADLVTAFPREEVVTWGERLLVPVIGFGIFTFIPIRLVQKLRWPALSITIGQFMLFRRAAYDAVGGYEAVGSEVVDDVCLGRRIIASGREWRLLDGTRHVSCRMYHGFWEAVAGFSKSLFAVFDYRILPYVFGWLLVGTAFIEPAVALVSRWLRHPVTSIPLEYAALSVGLSISLWMIAFRRFKFPAYLVFYYPLSLALFIAVAARSFIQTATGTTTWKDRILERVAMRWL
jgi:chlorobactene glucosyltransferase